MPLPDVDRTHLLRAAHARFGTAPLNSSRQNSDIDAILIADSDVRELNEQRIGQIVRWSPKSISLSVGAL